MSAYRQGPVAPPFPEAGHLPITPPPLSAWKSVPEAVRFAVWLWALGVILGFVGAVLFGVVFLVGMAVGS